MKVRRHLLGKKIVHYISYNMGHTRQGLVSRAGLTKVVVAVDGAVHPQLVQDWHHLLPPGESGHCCGREGGCASQLECITARVHHSYSASQQ